MEAINLNINDYTTKDNKQLSDKQIIILYKNNILNVNNMTYKEVFNTIGNIVNKPNADRGFDDDQYYDYHCPYSEYDLC